MSLFRRRRDAAVNEAPQTVATFYPDPRGAALFHRLTGAVHAPLVTAGAMMPQGGAQFGGYAPAPQSYRGLADLGGIRRGMPISQRSAQLAGERSTALTSASLQVFAQRSQRGLA